MINNRRSFQIRKGQRADVSYPHFKFHDCSNTGADAGALQICLLSKWLCVVQDGSLLLVQVYYKRLLNMVPCVFGNLEVINVSKMFVKEVATLAPERNIDSWTIPTGLTFLETFPVYAITFLQRLYSDATIVENYRTTHCRTWPICRARSSIEWVTIALFILNTWFELVAIKDSTQPNLQAPLDFCRARRIEKHTMNRYYYWSVPQRNRLKIWYETETYWGSFKARIWNEKK